MSNFLVNAETWYERMKTLREKETQVACPFCEVVQDLLDWPELVTFHGESGPIRFECQQCALAFWIEERVVRTYTVTLDNPADR